MSHQREGARVIVDVDEVKFELNTSDATNIQQVRSAIRRQLPQLTPHEVQDQVVAIVGGGPSLETTFDDLKEKYDKGMKVVSLNATHDWLIERGVRPSVHIQLDARAFNARFVENWHPKCKYLIASQSHPDVFDALEGAQVFLFHCLTMAKAQERELTDYYMGQCMYINGGSTVMTRAIPIMHTLGFKKQEIYGFDSCVLNDEHHAYPQFENDVSPYTTVEIDGKEFLCYGWMLKQAKDFIGFMKTIGQDVQLIVHGDGLIAHIIETNARKLEEK